MSELDLGPIEDRIAAGYYTFGDGTATITTLVTEVERLRQEKADAWNSGMRAVLRIRCMEHQDVPQYNTKESSGAECAACEVERLRELASRLKMDNEEIQGANNLLNAEVSRLQDEVSALRRTLKAASLVKQDCWIWPNGLHKGYPMMRLGGHRDGRTLLTCRLLLNIHEKGPSVLACHHCDEPACFNPAHLYVGTQQDNVNDRERRHPEDRRGEANHRAKLSEQDVQAIRLAAQQGESQRSIAKRFGIGSGHAANIIAGRCWKHLIDNPAPAPEAGPDDMLVGHGADCLCDTCCAAKALDATTRSEP